MPTFVVVTRDLSGDNTNKTHYCAKFIGTWVMIVFGSTFSDILIFSIGKLH